MKTKNVNTRSLLTKKTHYNIKLFFEFANHKKLCRQGWIKRWISREDCKTIAEYSFGFAILGYVLAEEYRPLFPIESL
ncbi:MAG: hypothetical protein QW757_00150 [Candidatus Woesearchaeota archaeon]